MPAKPKATAVSPTERPTAPIPPSQPTSVSSLTSPVLPLPTLKSLPPPIATNDEAPPPPENPLALLQARVYRNRAGQTLPYRLFVPWNFNPSADYPIVVFLHGANVRGRDNYRQLKGSGLPAISFMVSNELQKDFPSLVVVPQASTKWVRQWALVESPGANRKEPLELAVELIESLKQEFNIDTRRIYLTGVSMGAFGVWSGITRHPTLFAGAIAVAGGGSPALVRSNPTPVWAFHGSNDRRVHPRRSREMVAAFRRVGGHARYTEIYNLFPVLKSL